MRSERVRVIYVVILLWIVNIVNYADRMALAVLLPAIKQDLHLSDAQLGLLVGLAFAIFYGICGLPIAWLADRVARKGVIAVALALWSLMTIVSGGAMTFAQLFLARMGVGVGEAGCIPPSQSLICDLVPPRSRGGVLAFHAFGIAIGMMIGISVVSVLEGIVGWRWTFVVLGAPGLVLALIVWLTIREPQRGALDSAAASAHSTPLGPALRILRTNRAYVWIVIYLTMNGFVQFGLNQWWPSLFTRVFNISASAMGVPLGIAIAAGSGAGALLGAFVERLARRDRRRPLFIATVAMLASMITTAGSLFAPSYPLAVAAVGASLFLWSICTAPAFAALYNSTPPQLRAFAGALPIFFTAVIGLGLGPLVVGVASDLLRPALGIQSLQFAAIVPICLIPIPAFALWRASRNVSSECLDLSSDVCAMPLQSTE